MDFGIRKTRTWLARVLTAMMVMGGTFAGQESVGYADTYVNWENSSNNVLVVDSNEYTLNGVSATYEGWLLVSGNSSSSDSQNNHITINNGSIDFVEAGYSDSGKVSNNRISVNGGLGRGFTETKTDISGGRTYAGAVSNNTLEVNGGQLGGVMGGHSNAGMVSNNTVRISGGEVNHAYGGATYHTNENLTYPVDIGGLGPVAGNIVTVDGGTIGWVSGGVIGTTVDANGNESSSYPYIASVSGNTVTINNGTITQGVDGGNAVNGNTTDNIVNIHGGTITGNVYGGRVSSQGNTNYTYESSNNVINIYNHPDLTGSSLYGGAVIGSTGTVSGNTLNIHTTGLNAQRVSDFQNLNFYLDSNIQHGDTMLTVSTANLDNSTVQAVVEGGTPLTDGDSVTLLNATNSLSANNTTYASTISEGVSFNYPVTVSRNGNSIVAQIGNASSGGGSSGGVSLEEQTDILPIPLLDAVSLLDRGTSRLIDWLPPDEIEAMDIQTATKFEPFVSMGGGSLHFDTGHGSSLDAKTGGINGGFGRSVMNSSGRLVFAPIFDYGQDSYQSYLQDGTHGGGNSKYWAGGFIARQMNNNGMYYEGSFRAGNIKTSFVTDDFLSGGNRIHDSYRSSAPCFAGHVRVGWRAPVTRRDIVDVYGIYSHSHINGMDAHLTSGETYHFDATDSGMLRIGGRLVKQLKEQQRFYTGIAYQYEFSGDATGSYRGYETRKSSLSGSSGMIELGWQIKPTETSPLMLDVNATGWAGQQRGVTFQIKLKKAF